MIIRSYNPMSLKEQLTTDMKEAMRSKDNLRRDTVRLLLTAIKNAEIDKGGELTDQEVQALLQKQAKQRKDSITAYTDGGRPDLAESEQAELGIIEGYLPQQMGDDEIRAIVQAEISRLGISSSKDMGKLMGPLMAQLRGKADGAAVQRIVREELK